MFTFDQYLIPTLFVGGIFETTVGGTFEFR